MVFEHDKRVILYPNYINAKKTIAEGRRIPKDKGKDACENPNVVEMVDCCTKGLKLPAQIEDKSYSRDWLVRGRIRVQLKDDGGKALVADIPSRTALMLRIAELVPKHPMRSKRAQAQLQQQEKEAAQAAAAAAASTGSAGGKPKGKDKKKNRR
ncbi:MAG: signal recognition particle 19 kDa -like [Trebouxia sp. A1-2]|nr:MAG: signal recognition particle 19 kDa -like [Trebouxia sp. A1-2]